MPVTTTKDRVADVLKVIGSLTSERVLVGVPSTQGVRKPEADDPSPPNNAELAYIHEFGAPEANIPARPFLIPGVKNAKSKIVGRMEKAAGTALTEGGVDPARVLTQVGLVAQASVKAKITDGPFAPLSPVTLQKRKDKGRTGTKPLIDTGQLRNAINFVVRPTDAGS